MEFIIKTGGERLDKAIKKQETEISRTRLQKLIEEGKVKVNGKIEKNSYIVKIGDTFSISYYLILENDLNLNIPNSYIARLVSIFIITVLIDRNFCI